MSLITKILIPLADGVEEMEAVTPIDLLRRADFSITTAAVGKSIHIIGKNEIALTADRMLKDIKPEEMDAIIIPGGPAIFDLLEDENLHGFIHYFQSQKSPIGAICAAPLLLQKLGILKDKKFTGHRCIEETMPTLDKRNAVVVDDNIITSRGAGTATPFALTLIELWKGKKIADQIADDIHWNPSGKYRD